MASLHGDVHAAKVEHAVPAGEQVLRPVAAQSETRPDEEARAIARDPDRGSVGLPGLASVGWELDLPFPGCCFEDRLTELAHATHETARRRGLFRGRSPQVPPHQRGVSSAWRWRTKCRSRLSS